MMTEKDIKDFQNGLYQDELTPEEKAQIKKEFDEHNSIDIYIIIAIIILFLLFS